MRVELWFDFSCPYAYLASTQIEALCARTGATLDARPMLLGGVFRARAVPQKLFAAISPAKARHNALDLERWARRFGVPYDGMPSGHPFRTVEALRALLVVGAPFMPLAHAFFRAYWVEGRDLGERAVLVDVLTRAGHDAERVLTAAEAPAIKDELRARTDEAIALGIFGAPAFVVDGAALYWGQDRMHFVEGIPYDAWIASSNTGRPTVPHTLEVFFDFSSPYSYLGVSQVDALAARTGARVVWRPFLLGGLFKAIGQVDAPMLSWSDAKRLHTLKDMQRWADYYGVPYTFNSRFPTNSLKAMRCYLALPEERRAAFREATFRAVWAEDKDIGDEAVLREILGADADATLAAAATPAVKDALKKSTEDALAAGVFGAPTFVVDGEELFWGQDRLPLVERALRA